MNNFEICSNILSAKIISNVSPALKKELNIKHDHKSIGMITAEIDLPAYTALDQVTKMVDVELVYAKSTYGGHTNATTKLAGEFIGILSGGTTEDVKTALTLASNYMKDSLCGEIQFADEENSIPYYAHCIPRPGTYFKTATNISENESIAFLIAPPLESMYALDSVLKSADVKIRVLWKPPTATNFGGALISGNESSCTTACKSFSEAIITIAKTPIDI